MGSTDSRLAGSLSAALYTAATAPLRERTEGGRTKDCIQEGHGLDLPAHRVQDGTPCPVGNG